MKNKQQMRWGEKPYYSLDYYLRSNYGEKIYKIALDGGMSCPNRDGTCGTKGCIFCSEGGSGDFAIKKQNTLSVTEQINQGISFLQSHSKYCGRSYIAYFQSYSNTYAPIDTLRRLYMEALSHPAVKILSIATRPDCFTSEIFDLLEECNAIKPVWVELGLQTIHEKTATLIRRGYPLEVYEKTVAELKKRNIPIITHVILGLPGETPEMIFQTIAFLNQIKTDGIKLQLLHILEHTVLGDAYRAQISADPMQPTLESPTTYNTSLSSQNNTLQDHIPWIQPYSIEEYISILLQCIARLSPEIVIHRLTGDGPKDLLITPLWSTNKRNVLNLIAHQMKIQHIYQGCQFTEQTERSTL